MSLMPSISDYVEDYAPWTAIMEERLHPVQYPQGEAGPWSVFRLKEEDREYANNGPAELRMAEIEWTILSSDYGQAHDLAKILSDRLDRLRGLVGDVDIHDTLFIDSRDGEIVDEVLGLYSVICKISVWYVHA